MARIVSELLDALELSDVTIVANDTGGAVSQALVGRHPERMGRLVVTSCDAFENFPPKAVAFWAADDRFFPREHGRRLAELLPQGRFELVDESRTFILEDNPAALVSLLRSLL